MKFTLFLVHIYFLINIIQVIYIYFYNYNFFYYHKKSNTHALHFY